LSRPSGDAMGAAFLDNTVQYRWVSRRPNAGIHPPLRELILVFAIESRISKRKYYNPEERIKKILIIHTCLQYQNN